MRRPDSHSAFQFISNVFGGAEVRALYRPSFVGDISDHIFYIWLLFTGAGSQTVQSTQHHSLTAQNGSLGQRWYHIIAHSEKGWQHRINRGDPGVAGLFIGGSIYVIKHILTYLSSWERALNIGGYILHFFLALYIYALYNGISINLVF